MREHGREIGVFLEHYEDVHTPSLMKATSALPPFNGRHRQPHAAELVSLAAPTASNPLPRAKFRWSSRSAPAVARLIRSTVAVLDSRALIDAPASTSKSHTDH